MPIRRSLSFGAVTACLLVGALVAVPASAEAKSYVHDDPRGDVNNVSVSGWPLVPDRTNGDIIRMRAWHTKSRIRVRLVFAELFRESPTTQVIPEFRFITNKRTRGVYLLAGRRNPTGMGYMYRFSDYAHVRCALSYSFDFVNNVVSLGFSRRCLGNPRWVRISASTETAEHNDEDQLTGIYADNAQRTGLDYSIHLNYSPRIRRG